MHRYIFILCSLALGAWLFFIVRVPDAAAQASTLSAADVLRNEAVVDFPQSVMFQLELDPGVTVTNAVLTYDVPEESCLDVSTQVPVAVDGSTLEWEWVMIRSGNPPPGAELWWEWTLTDEDGNTYTTPRQSHMFVDDRFEWQSVSEDDITLNWYEGAEVGPMLLDAAVEGLALLEADMGIELQEPVSFYIYGNAGDMREAVLYIQDWAGGVAFSEYNVILMGVEPRAASDWGRKTVRHELAHLVLAQFARSCVGGRRPTWLEEGIAMYAEGKPSERVATDLQLGISQNSFEPVRSLNGAFPAHGDAAGSAYSQSYSIVQFLRESYGQEKLQALLLKLAEGHTYDEALLDVYGFTVDGLEQEWRVWIGVPPRLIPPTPTPVSAAAVPTVVPLAGPASVPTPATYVDYGEPAAPGATGTLGLCGAGLAPLAIVGFGWWVTQGRAARRRPEGKRGQ